MHVVPVSSILDETGELVQRISSAPAYDRALSSIFTHLIFVSYKDAEVLGAALDRGLGEEPQDGTVGSYASVVDFRTGGKVLWLSDSSLYVLKASLKAEEYAVMSQVALFQQQPRHLA